MHNKQLTQALILTSLPGCNSFAALLHNLWKTRGDSTGHKETLGLPSPHSLSSLHSLFSLLKRQESVLHKILIVLLIYILEDEQPCMCSLTMLLKPY